MPFWLAMNCKSSSSAALIGSSACGGAVSRIDAAFRNRISPVIKLNENIPRMLRDTTLRDILLPLPSREPLPPFDAIHVESAQLTSCWGSGHPTQWHTPTMEHILMPVTCCAMTKLCHMLQEQGRILLQKALKERRSPQLGCGRAPKPQSTERARVKGLLKKQKGTPLNLG